MLQGALPELLAAGRAQPFPFLAVAAVRFSAPLAPYAIRWRMHSGISPVVFSLLLRAFFFPFDELLPVTEEHPRPANSAGTRPGVAWRRHFSRRKSWGYS